VNIDAWKTATRHDGSDAFMALTRTFPASIRTSAENRPLRQLFIDPPGFRQLICRDDIPTTSNYQQQMLQSIYSLEIFLQPYRNPEESKSKAARNDPCELYVRNVLNRDSELIFELASLRHAALATQFRCGSSGIDHNVTSRESP
jgi:hypothetical protein